MVRQADAFVERLRRDAGDDDAQRIKRAYSLLVGRPPSDRELDLGLAFVVADDEHHDARWSQYAQVLLASNEVLMLD